jgi:uracil phosphoribosyltransferase
MSEYNRTHVLLAQQFEEKTNLELQQAQQANENSSNYVFLSVLYSSSLFIDGVIGRTSNKKLGHILLYITMTITTIATIILIQIPTATKFFGS